MADKAMSFGRRLFTFFICFSSLSLSYAFCTTGTLKSPHCLRIFGADDAISALRGFSAPSVNQFCKHVLAHKHEPTRERPIYSELVDPEISRLIHPNIEPGHVGFYECRYSGRSDESHVAGADIAPAKISSSLTEENSRGLKWLSHYGQALAEAARANKDLLIHFTASGDDWRHRRFKTETATQPGVSRLLRKFVCVRLPRGHTVLVDGEKRVLLQLTNFEVMQRQGGLAVVDFSHPDSKNYGQVIGGLPFIKPIYYAAPFESPSSVSTFLGLPSGSLAERMMIYAIRMHPEGPQSTSGVSSPVLRKAASTHSQRQALLGRQGHQQWQSRFQQIWKQIGGKPPIEVCAESWPDEPLITACLGCVHAWRQSAGHWQAVSSGHRIYAYSIHRGNNRIWYATGIFGG